MSKLSKGCCSIDVFRTYIFYFDSIPE